jgi:hypothetical protein
MTALRIQAVSGIALVAITGYYTYYAGQQARLTREVIENTQRDQRAWVSAVDLKPVIGTGVVLVTMTNSGKTPALRLDCHAEAKLLIDLPNTARPQLSNSHAASVGVLGPGATAACVAKEESVKPGDDARNKRVFVFGTITDEDVRRQSHWTDYCFVFVPQADPRSAPPVFQACERWNEVDQE